MFLFGDTINEDEEILFDGNYKWLRQIREYYFFLSNMERIFPLSYLQSISLPWYMDWDLVRAQSGITIGTISNRVAFPVGHSREVLTLFPGSLKQKFPTSETPKQVATFISRFMEVKGEFPQSNFQTPVWVYSMMTAWWMKMFSFILEELEEPKN